jgi:nitroimidazol reductase NimA-like FMN-containing flavoprotein (pyridoxamine 5'-phosphate oxidase superfamily)
MDDAERARAIIDANAYLTLATADEAGRPWASPVWFAHDAFRELVWVSRPGARHSQNIAVRPEVGIVLFDSTVPIGTGTAVYIEAAAEAAAPADIERRVATFSKRSLAQGGVAWSADDVTGDSPFRLYLARATTHYVLDDHDQRIEVDLTP